MGTTISRAGSTSAPVTQPIDDDVDTGAAAAPADDVSTQQPSDDFAVTGPASPDAAAVRTLDPAVSKAVSDDLAGLTDPVAKRNVTELVSSDGFRNLSTESQQEALKALMKAPGDAQYAADIKSTVNNGGPYAVLKQGSTGPAVKAMQDQLRAAGFDPGPSDSKFGPLTEKALKAYQSANGLKPDGSAGVETLGKLNGKSFSSLDQASQTKLLQGLAAQSNDPDARQTLTHTATSPGFQALKPDERGALLDKVTGTTKQAADARATLKDTLADPAFASGTPDAQAQRLRTFTTGQTSVDSLSSNPEFQKLDDATKTRVLNDARTNAGNATYVQDLTRLVTDGRFTTMSVQDRGRAMDVFENTTPAGRQALQNLLHRDVGGVPALQSRGTTPNSPTLLEQLQRQATTPLDARVPNAANPATRAALSESMLQEVSDPGHYINQNNRGSCAATSISYQLATSNPAEYARIQTDLSTKGTATLADGSTMTAPADAWAADSSNRSTGERLMQSAFMQYAHPTSTYHNAWNPPRTLGDPTNPTGTTVDGFDDRIGSGLFAPEENHLLHGLYNRDFNTYTGSWVPFTDDHANRISEAQRQLDAGHGPLLVDMDWGTGGHAVEVTAIRDGRVYFRNPWGGSDATNWGVGNTGNVNTNPPRRTEDGYGGMESMTLADFQSRIRNVHVPD